MKLQIFLEHNHFGGKHAKINKIQCMVQIKNLKSKIKNLNDLYSNKKSTMIVKIILNGKITLSKLYCFVFFNKY